MQFRDLPKQYEVLKCQIDEAMVKVAPDAALAAIQSVLAAS